MPKFLAPINLTFNELQNATIQNLSSPPTVPASIGGGGVYYDTSSNRISINVGTAGSPSWTTLSTAVDTGVAFSVISDGTSTTTADASGDTVLFATGNTILSIVASNPGPNTVTFTINQGNITHNSIGGLTTGDPHTQYAFLAGRSSGQTLKGGTATTDNLTLLATSNGTNSGAVVINTAVSVATGTITLTDAVNYAYGTTTGTKFGTSTSQKIGFFNTAPVAQQAQTTDLQIALQNLGLVAAGSSAYNLNLHGGTLTAGAFSGPGTGLTGVALLASANTFSVSGNNITFTDTSSSGTVNALKLNPTYNQTSTANATDFLINRVETAVANTQLFVDFQVSGTSKFKVSNTGTVTLVDAANFVFGTSTGTKFGTATTQKIGFFNATPVVQPSSGTDLITALSNLGLVVSASTPLSLQGGTLTAPTYTYGGAMSFAPGSNSSTGYAVSITGGVSTLISGVGGAVNITGGVNNATTATGGTVNITGGAGTNGGSVFITPGLAGTGQDGYFKVSTAGGGAMLQIGGPAIADNTIGFFGVTPVAQPGATISLETVLSNLGLRASGTSAPLAIAQLTIADASNIVLGTTTGTKIGTSTSQKIGFFNATPVIQPASGTDLITALSNLGLVVSASTPLSLQGGTLTTPTITNAGAMTYGPGTSASTGFAVSITGGATTLTSGTAGAVNIVGGGSIATTSVGGSVIIKGGAATATNGSVNIQNSGGTNQIQVNSTGIGFFNVTPVAQQGQTTDLQVVLQNLGLVAAGSSAYNLNLHGGTLTAGAFSGPGTGLTGVALLASANTFSVSGNNITFTDTSSSGTVNAFKLNPTYNQTSTANATDFLINRVETVVANTQLFADFQVSGTSKFSVDHLGNIITAGTTLIGGAGYTIAAGGAITIQPTTLGTSSSVGYNTIISGGNNSGTGSNAGAVSIIGGTCSGGSTTIGGSVNIQGGTGSATQGAVTISNQAGVTQIQVNATGIGFFNVTPVAKPSSTTDLRTALINLGLYTTGGATPLNLNGGAFTALTGTFTQTTGTAPFTISSTTLVSNLNADFVDGAHASATPTASTIPIANGSNKLASGWISQVLATTDLTDVTSHTGTGTVAVFQASPTLTTPTIADFTNATHNHTNAAGGGTLTHAAISDFDTQVRTSRLDQMAVPTASVSMNSQKITNLLDPTNPQDAATKNYVDATATGLDFKQSVRVASTANITVTYTATAGASTRGQITAAPNIVDGVTLVNGNRILLKNQTTGAQNGIYAVTTVGTGVNGTWDRATDFDQDAEVTSGAFVFVEEGTANADSGWVLATVNPITIGGASGTTLVFTQFSGAGTYTAGNGLTLTGTVFSINTSGSGLSFTSGALVTNGNLAALNSASGTGIYAITSSGSTSAVRTLTGTSNRLAISNGDGVSGNPTFDIASTYVGQTSITTLGTITTGTWNGTTIAVLNGGTGGTTAAAAKTNLGFMTRYAGTVTGDGTTTSFAFTHNLGTQDVLVEVRESVSPYAVVFPDYRDTDVNTVTIVFGIAPSNTTTYRVVVVG